MIRKVFSVLAIIMILNGEYVAFSQDQHKADSEFTALLGSATLGATLGTLSTGFLEFSSLWASYCRSTLSGQEFIKRLEERYSWERFLGLMLGPPTGALVGIMVVSKLYGLEGDTGLSFISSFTGVLGGLGLGCILLRTTKQPELEFVTPVLTIGMVAFGAVVFYGAQSRSSPRMSHQQISSVPSLNIILWSLRF